MSDQFFDTPWCMITIYNFENRADYFLRGVDSQEVVSLFLFTIERLFFVKDKTKGMLGKKK